MRPRLALAASLLAAVPPQAAAEDAHVAVHADCSAGATVLARVPIGVCACYTEEAGGGCEGRQQLTAVGTPLMGDDGNRITYYEWRYFASAADTACDSAPDATVSSYRVQGTLQPGSCPTWGSAGRGLRMYDRFPTTLRPAGDSNCHGCLPHLPLAYLKCTSTTCTSSTAEGMCSGAAPCQATGNNCRSCHEELTPCSQGYYALPVPPHPPLPPPLPAWCLFSLTAVWLAVWLCRPRTRNAAAPPAFRASRRRTAAA